MTPYTQFMKLAGTSPLMPCPRNLCFLLFTSLLLLSSVAFSADTPFEFASKETEASYQKLLAELRCLVCQNQSLADSHADLAQDLRNEVYKMLQAGKNDDDIRQFMVDRYGDFVLYKPPIKPTTILLWFGPLFLIAIAMVAVWSTIKRQQRAPQELNPEQEQFVRHLREENQGQNSSVNKL